MDYIEVTLSNFGNFDPEIILARMSGLGFESFSETDDAMQGYIREDAWNKSEVEEFLQQIKAEHGIQYAIQKIPAQNWNALWESAYEPVTVAGKCQVRAPFHQPVPGMQYDIVIEPKMSFGTAHHETTSLMLEMIMTEELKDKRVLDMGCGTGVLAILAHKMQAAEVVAIDNDDWAYANAPENVAANDAAAIQVIMGDASAIPLPEYDLIVANINRNVLLNDIPVYARFLKPHGALLLSGFYSSDLDLINEAARNAGLQYFSHKTANNWIGAKFVK
jgi:ribosomal protein L11 methyltransferase